MRGTDKSTVLEDMSDQELRVERRTTFGLLRDANGQLTAMLALALGKRFPDKPFKKVVRELFGRGESDFWHILSGAYLEGTKFHESSVERRFRSVAEIVLGCLSEQDSDVAEETHEELAMQILTVDRLLARIRMIDVLQRERRAEATPAVFSIYANTGQQPNKTYVPFPPPVADAPGHGCRPDPTTATTVPEFVDKLTDFYVWSGAPGIREIARRCDMSHPSISAMLNTRDKLPALEKVTTFVGILGGSIEDQALWASTWRKLKLAERTRIRAFENQIVTVLTTITKAG